MATDETPLNEHRNMVRQLMVESLVGGFTGAMGSGVRAAGTGASALRQAIKQKAMVQRALDFFKPKSSNADDLMSAFRGAAKKYHPDIAGKQGTGIMKDVNRHWDVLKDNLDYLP